MVGKSFFLFSKRRSVIAFCHPRRPLPEKTGLHPKWFSQNILRAVLLTGFLDMITN
jgi:hypothetical protein